MFCFNRYFNQNIGNWDVSNVVNMNSTFARAFSFNQDIGDWDVSSVTNMSHLFYLAYDFDQNIGDWDVSNVTCMSYMFDSSYFNQDIRDWDVSNVTQMDNMFRGTWHFNQNLSSWDVSNVTTMSSMFQSALYFNQDISNWDVRNVTDMYAMFSGAYNFNQDIGSWDVSNVNNMRLMFLMAYGFNQDISRWCVEQFTVEPDHFSDGCPMLLEYKPHWGDTCYSEIILCTQNDIDNFSIDYPNTTNFQGNITINDTATGEITNLLGLANLIKISGALTIIQNDSLHSLEGLNNIDSIGYYLRIGNNNELMDIAELENLYYINSNIKIQGNYSLISLGGLNNLDTIKKLSINDNELLSSIESIADATITSWTSISNNPNLEVCNVKSICEFIFNNPDDVIISNNAPGCNNINEVEELCLLDRPEHNSSILLQYFPNPSDNIININGIKPENINKITVRDLSHKKVLSTYNTNRVDLSNLKSGIYIIELKGNGRTYRNKIIKR